MHAGIVYKVMLTVTQRVLFESLGLNWFLLHLHICVPRSKVELILIRLKLPLSTKPRPYLRLYF